MILVLPKVTMFFVFILLSKGFIALKVYFSFYFPFGVKFCIWCEVRLRPLVPRLLLDSLDPPSSSRPGCLYSLESFHIMPVLVYITLLS